MSNSSADVGIIMGSQSDWPTLKHAAGILTELGVHDMVLLTNSHHTLIALDGYGLSVVGERPVPVAE